MSDNVVRFKVDNISIGSPKFEGSLPITLSVGEYEVKNILPLVLLQMQKGIVYEVEIREVRA